MDTLKSVTKMKILITGAAGFIGANLCEYMLSQGYAVIGLDIDYSEISGGGKTMLMLPYKVQLYISNQHKLNSDKKHLWAKFYLYLNFRGAHVLNAHCAPRFKQK